jgi:FlaG/FlaF family flagellin (archaellin)
MQQKTKTIIAVVVILLATVLAVIFIFKTKTQAPAIAPVQKVETPQAQAPKTFSTVFVEGAVVSLESNELKIKSGDSVIPISLNEKALVYSKDGETIVKKETSDLKEGTKIKVEIDKQNSMGLGVEILN